MRKNNKAPNQECRRIQVVRYLARYAQSTPSDAAYQDNLTLRDDAFAARQKDPKSLTAIYKPSKIEIRCLCSLGFGRRGIARSLLLRVWDNEIFTALTKW